MTPAQQKYQQHRDACLKHLKTLESKLAELDALMGDSTYISYETRCRLEWAAGYLNDAIQNVTGEIRSLKDQQSLKTETCPECGGAGRIAAPSYPDVNITCPWCEGTGLRVLTKTA